VSSNFEQFAFLEIFLVDDWNGSHACDSQIVCYLENGEAASQQSAVEITQFANPTSDFGYGAGGTRKCMASREGGWELQIQSPQ
jgi:hypothetical protein